MVTNYKADMKREYNSHLLNKSHRRFDFVSFQRDQLFLCLDTSTVQ